MNNVSRASRYSVVSLFGLFWFLASALAAPSGKEIMTKNEDARRLSDTTASAVLATGGGDLTTRVKRFTWWRKLQSDRTRYNTLTRFHAPAEIRGEGILFLEHSNDQNDVLMYLPTFKKIRRIESQQQNSSFMGSEFSYADIATPHVDDYNHKLIRDEACPGETNTKLRCFIVEAEPGSEHVKERTGYSRTVSWVRPDNFMVVKAEYYDIPGALWKRFEAADLREVDQSAHKWMAFQLKIENVKNGHYTKLDFSNVKVNTGVPDSTFTEQNLMREK